MAPPTDRKASSLERPPMSELEEIKNNIDRQTRTTLEHHRQAQDRLGSMERAEEGRRGHKTGTCARCKAVTHLTLMSIKRIQMYSLSINWTDKWTVPTIELTAAWTDHHESHVSGMVTKRL